MFKIKIINLLSIFLLVVACSKQSGKGSSPVNVGEPESVIALSAITLNTTEGNIIPSSSVDFGSVEKGKNIQQSITITNKQISSLVITAETFDASNIAPFELVSNSCITSLSRNRSCKIVIQLTNPTNLLESIELSKSLSINGSLINLTGEQLLYVEPTAPISGITLSPQNLNFGSLNIGESKELTIIVSNKTIGRINWNSPSFNNPNIVFTSECPALIERNRSCSMRFKYTATNTEDVTNQSLVSLYNNPVSYSVLVTEPVEEIVNIVPSVLSSSESLTEPATIQKVVQFQNKGLNISNPIEAVVSSPGIQINSIACSAGLNRNRVCSVSYSLNSALLPGGNTVQTIQLKSGLLLSSSYSLNLNIVKTAPIISFEAIDTTPSCSSLALIACSNNVSVTRTYSCQKLINGVVDSSYVSNENDCSLSNTTPIICSSPAGTISEVITGGTKTSSCLESSSVKNFVSVDCTSPNYEENGEICSLASYTPVYSAYGACSTPLPCQGMGTKSRVLDSCQKYLDGSPVIGGIPSNCTSLDLTSSCASPASNNVITTIDNGQIINSCAEGETLKVFVSINCNNNFQPSVENDSCIAEEPTVLTGPWQIAIHNTDVPSYTDNSASIPVHATISTQQTWTAPSATLNPSAAPTNASIAPVNNGVAAIANLNYNEMQPDAGGFYVYSKEGASLVYNLATILANISQGLFFDPAENVSIPVVRYTVSQVLNIKSNSGDAPANAFVFGGNVYFSATNIDLFTKLFKMTPAGVVSQVSNTRPGGADSPANLTLFANELYFTALNSGGFNKLYKMTSAGIISQVSNTRNGNTDNPISLTVLGTDLYFAANNSSGYQKLFKMTSAGAVSQISNLRSTATDGISNLKVFANEIYFSGMNAVGYRKLYKASAAGAVSQLSNTCGINCHDSPGNLYEYGSQLYFSSMTSNLGTNKLFKITSAGAVSQVANTEPTTNYDESRNLTEYSGSLYFVSSIPSGYIKLFKMTSAGVVSQVSNIVSSGSDGISDLIVYNGELYFVAAANSSGHTKLHKINSAGVISQVSNTRSSNIDTISNLVIHGNELYFSAAITGSGAYIKLFKIDTSGIVSQVSNTRGASGSDTISSLFVFNGELYFRANNSLSQAKLYKVQKQ